LTTVKAVAIRELKNRLSAYLREVARGEIVLVTDRGRVVAELRRPSGELVPSRLDQALETLHAEGALLPGLPQDRAAYRRTRVRLRGASQALLDADREDR
jgi:antitoxin (DNA-binding transcriptional repressor) of toxin-antitoxin stability system